MNATAYAPTDNRNDTRTAGDWTGGAYWPADEAQLGVMLVFPAQPTATRSGPPGMIEEISALLEAAGALTVDDIAGGLDLSVDTASAWVNEMLHQDCLREDEWNRYSLRGACGEVSTRAA